MLGFLVITGLIFVGIGLRALLKPVEAVAVPFGLQTDGIDGLNHLRASSGRVTILAGLVAIGPLFSGGPRASLIAGFGGRVFKTPPFVRGSGCAGMCLGGI